MKISFLFCRKYIFIFWVINFFNNSVFGEEIKCLNYPYPEGIYMKSNPSNKKQLIYTKSVSIKSQNIKKIEYIKKKNNLYAIASLNKQIKINFPNLKEEEIGIYNLNSCFNSDGIYKVSFAMREVKLKKLNIFQKVKKILKMSF
tara:strand:+ start:71 stop:502 length:432 start_codon:yes stop_codon:yes gene_type:complete